MKLRSLSLSMNKEHPFMQVSAKSLCTFNKIQSVSVLSITGKVRFLRQEKKKPKHNTQVSVCPRARLKGKDQHGFQFHVFVLSMEEIPPTPANRQKAWTLNLG